MGPSGLPGLQLTPASWGWLLSLEAIAVALIYFLRKQHLGPLSQKFGSGRYQKSLFFLQDFSHSPYPSDFNGSCQGPDVEKNCCPNCSVYSFESFSLCLRDLRP
jgi:hypothetical protein